MLEDTVHMLRRFCKLLVETVHAWQRDHASLMAAALSFYTLIALAPLLIIVLSTASLWFGPEEVQEQVLRGAAVLLGARGAELLDSVGEGAHLRGGGLAATLVSLGIVIYGSTRVFGELQRALAVVWRRPDLPDEGFHPLRWLRTHLFSFLMVIGAGLLWLIGVVSATVIAGLGAWMSDRITLPEGLVLARVVQPIASVLLLTLALAPLYRFFSQGRACWSESWLGAMLTAVMMTAGQKLMGMYLGHRTISSVYGAAGSLIVVVLWLYYSWMTFLLGAELTKVATVLRARRRDR
jgi:membrane protein